MSQLDDYLQHYDRTVTPAMSAMSERLTADADAQRQMQARQAFAERLGQIEPINPDTPITQESFNQYYDPAMQYFAQTGDISGVTLARNQTGMLQNQFEAQQQAARDARLHAQRMAELGVTQRDKATKTATQQQDRRREKFSDFEISQSQKLPKTRPYKEWLSAKANYDEAKALIDQSEGAFTGTADSALIMKWNKMLDEGSTVREGEYDRAKEYNSTLSQLRVYFNKVTKGQDLTPEVRADMLKAMDAFYEMRLEMAANKAKQVKSQYNNRADIYKINPEDRDVYRVIGENDPETELQQYRENKRVDANYAKFLKARGIEDPSMVPADQEAQIKESIRQMLANKANENGGKKKK